MKNNSHEEDNLGGDDHAGEPQEDFFNQKKPSRPPKFAPPVKEKAETADDEIGNQDEAKNDQLISLDFSEPKKVGRPPKLLGRPTRAKKTDPSANEGAEQDGQQGDEVEIKAPTPRPKPQARPKVIPKQENGELEDQNDGLKQEELPSNLSEKPLQGHTTLAGENPEKDDNENKMDKPWLKNRGKPTQSPTPVLEVIESKVNADEDRQNQGGENIDDIIVAKAKPQPAKPALAKPKPEEEKEVAPLKEAEPVENPDDETNKPLVNNFTASPLEDRPLGSKVGPTGGYDLDNLDKFKDTYVPSKKAQAKKVEEPPAPKPVATFDDDRPLGGKGPDAGYNLDNLDKMQDTYVPSKKALAKKVEAPAPAKQVIDEDRPLGGKGPDAGYNLDNLEEMEKMYKPSNKALANKKPPVQPNTDEPQAKSDDQPIKPSTSIKNPDAPIKDVDDLPIGGGNKATNPFNEANAFPSGAQPNDDGGIDDADATLEGRMKSPNFATKSKAFDDVLLWADATVTPELVAKGMHLTVKEKHPQILDRVLSIIENLMENHKTAWATVDFKKFLVNFAEHLMTNVKGASKDHSNVVIPLIWNNSKKEDFCATIKDEMLKKSKVKLQENALIIILELVKVGKIEELQFFKPFKDELEAMLASRSVSLKNIAMSIYKESYLWLGDALKAFTSTVKKPQMDELEAYFKTVDPSQMKALRKDDGKGGKAKAVDVYDLVSEVELPKKFNEESWVDEVVAMAKWNERKAAIDELNEILIKSPKLSPKTNAFNFLNLARRVFMDSNVAVQVSTIKTLGLLAASLRKHFQTVAKTMFPSLLVKLKEKNRALSEEIISTLEKFYGTLTFDETHDDLKEHLKDKNTDKKINLLKIMLTMVDKLDKIKTDANAVKLVKLVLPLLDENDLNVRDSTSQLIAKLKDNFNDKVTPLLSDLPSVKMTKIAKFCQNSSSIVTPGSNGKGDKAETIEKDAKQQDEPKASTRNIKSSMAKDKSQMIADMRENLFSNKTVKVSNVKQFSDFLYTNLKTLSDMTKDFKEVSTTQSKEIIILIAEIAAKVDKAAFPEDSRKAIIRFYIEQFLGKANDEIMESLDQLLYHQNKIVTPKIFMTDMFDVMGKTNNFKVSRELLVAILRIIDKEISNNSQLTLMPHKAFIDFLKSNFSGQSIHASYKTPLLSTMRNYQKKFGEKSLNDFPANLLKELAQQNQDLDKIATKIMDNLSNKNPDKKKAALMELANYEDPQKIALIWNAPEFISFLKRMLLMEVRGLNYGSLLMILSRYMILYKESPGDFSLKSYIFVFQAVLTHYYDRKDNDKFNPEIESLVRSTVNTIGATNILNELMADTNSSISWKEQILHFYNQFVNEIDTGIKFITYLITLVGQKGPASEIKSLVDSVLLLLKGTHNDELILKGNENKYIRETWQKNEEDLLINENFIKGYQIFEDSGSFQIVKNFISESLEIKDNNFYNRNIDQYAINDQDSTKKIKLAYFYMRSVENVPRSNEFILRNLMSIDLGELDEVSLLIALKTTFQILKNTLYMQGDEMFGKAKDTFTNILHRLPLTFDEFYRKADFSGHEINFFGMLINNEEFKMPEYEPPTPARVNSKNGATPTISDLPSMQTPMPNKDPSSRNNPNRTQIQIQTAMDDEDIPLSKNPREIMNIPASPRSHVSSSRKGVTAQQNAKKGNNFSNQQADNISNNNFNPPVQEVVINAYPPQIGGGDGLENPIILQEKFAQMMTFNLDAFEDASEYFKALCRSPNPSSHNFLRAHSNDIIKVFVDVCVKVFEEGINFMLERSTYELIFVPFQQLCAIDDFLLTLQQPILNYLVEHVLQRLVLSNEEKTQLEQEEEDQSKQELAGFMVKFWNSIMLRVIENAECNSLLTALFILIININDFETDKIHQAIYNLAFKCIIRITRNLKNIINKIDPRIVLNLIFNYIQTFGVKNSESLGTKSIKTLLNELVIRSDPDFIWNCYLETFGNEGEPHISKWIQVIQMRNGIEVSQKNPRNLEAELLEIIGEINKLNRLAQVNTFIPEIRRILEEEPALDIRNYASAFGNKTVFDHIMKELRSGKNATPNYASTSKQNPMQGGNNFNNTVGFSNQKSGANQSMSKGNGGQLPTKSPINPRKPQNIDDYLNNSDLGDTSEVYRRMDDRSRYNFN